MGGANGEVTAEEKKCLSKGRGGVGEEVRLVHPECGYTSYVKKWTDCRGCFVIEPMTERRLAIRMNTNKHTPRTSTISLANGYSTVAPLLF